MEYDEIKNFLLNNKLNWLITGVAGFIGSNLLEALLKLDQTVVGIDNFKTGYNHNLTDVYKNVSQEQWKQFSFIEGDVTDFRLCSKATKNIDCILHQAALGSVPRSIEDPIASNNSNITGFLNMLVSAKDNNVKSFVYAASSSTYGDEVSLPKKENKIGKPLSPYAVTKLVNEIYANLFRNTYGFHAIGLRYFNVFGKRQDPDGAYAAVIPKWIDAMINEKPIFINGDGKTSRDFCYIENVVQANILSAALPLTKEVSKITTDLVFNIAYGQQTSLIELFKLLKTNIEDLSLNKHISDFHLRDFRIGDVRHSLADISKAKRYLGYEPSHSVFEGLKETVNWYLNEA